MSNSLPGSNIEDWFYHPSVRMNMDATYHGWLPENHGKLVERNYLLFGGRAVSYHEPEMFNVIHEMAHLIEIDDARAITPGWGLQAGTWKEIPGLWSGREAQTAQCIEREVRVMAIQAVITEHLGFAVDYHEMAKLLANGAVPGYYYFRNKVGCDYEDEKGHSFIRNNNRVQRVKKPGLAHHICASVILSLASSFSIQSIWDEWCRKQEVVAKLFIKKETDDD